MKKYRIIETICVVLAAGFICFTLFSDKGTDKSAAQIVKGVVGTVGELGLNERGIEDVRRVFGFSSEDFDSFAYYSSDDVMNVSEMLVLVLDENSDVQILSEKIKGHAADRYAVFKGYAAQQAGELKNYVLRIRGNALLFCVGENAGNVLDAFMAAL